MVPERDDVVLDAWAHEFCDVGEECVVGGCGAEGDDDSTWLAGWGLGVGVRTSADFDEEVEGCELPGAAEAGVGGWDGGWKRSWLRLGLLLATTEDAREKAGTSCLGGKRCVCFDRRWCSL